MLFKLPRISPPAVTRQRSSPCEMLRDHRYELFECIYIGRRFRNDTERLEKLFEMYTKMTTKVSA